MFMLQGHPYRIHSFLYNGFNVWGLTATILIKASDLVWEYAQGRMLSRQFPFR